MAKFLDKKQNVIDFRLTPYGKHRLAEGRFKPQFYGFFDDNIIYDLSYIASGSSDTVPENQNNIYNRIKKETPYLGTQVNFTEVQKADYYQDRYVEPTPDYMMDFYGMSTYEDAGWATLGGSLPFYRYAEYKFKDGRELTIDKELIANSADATFRHEQMIGDAKLESNSSNMPSWKFVALQGEIYQAFDKNLVEEGGSFGEIDGRIGLKSRDYLRDQEIPQIDFILKYNLKVKDMNYFDLAGGQDLLNTNNINVAEFFDDGRYVELESDDLVFYLEEENTVFLDENFDIEVFEYYDDTLPDTPGDKSFGAHTHHVRLKRKTFDKDYKKLKGDLITQEYIDNYDAPIAYHDSTCVENYFDINLDKNVDKQIACKSLQTYNKQSYYLNIDFDCADSQYQNVYNDIYGPVTEPELCQ